MLHTPITVSLLNESVQEILEANFPSIWVEGEISNYHQASSGHAYFSLKDDVAQVRCALFKGQRFKVNFPLKDGLHIQVRAQVTLYAGRGDYQLLIHEVIDAGLGALQRAFEALKTRLKLEGLFEEKRKKSLPALAWHIGVITSSKGAALRDILSTLKRRHPLATVWIYPTLVQGPQSAPFITQAIDQAKAHAQCDVLIIARGGGSLEDLWGFNEESVVRAIATCPIPVVSGVGHETDTTLSDWVADLRAPTPTAAAESVSIDSKAWLLQLAQQYQRLIIRMQRFLQNHAQHLDYLSRRLKHPKEKLNQQQKTLENLNHRMLHAMQHTLEHRQARLESLARTLHVLSPLTTLARGYSIVRQGEKIITKAKQLKAEEPLTLTLAEGEVVCRLV